MFLSCLLTSTAVFMLRPLMKFSKHQCCECHGKKVMTVKSDQPQIQTLRTCVLAIPPSVPGHKAHGSIYDFQVLYLVTVDSPECPVDVQQCDMVTLIWDKLAPRGCRLFLLQGDTETHSASQPQTRYQSPRNGEIEIELPQHHWGVSYLAKWCAQNWLHRQNGNNRQHFLSGN